MSDQLQKIQKAIDTFQMDEARRLLADELQHNPSSEAYYLASQAAKNHGQRVHYLEQALELDPFHQMAHDELAGIMPPSMNAPRTPPSPAPMRKPKAKNTVTAPLTSIGKRFVAMIIDAVILGIIGMIFGGIFGTFFGPDLSGYASYETLNDALIEEFLQFQMTVIMISLLINAAYHIYFMTKTNGQTPGKKIMNIRVVKKDGTPITFVDALLRNIIGYALSGAILIGYLWALIDSEKQAWHDKIAGTVVIDEPQEYKKL